MDIHPTIGEQFGNICVLTTAEDGWVYEDEYRWLYTINEINQTNWENFENSRYIAAEI